ncbi:unnamed protein product [Alopecurus aequalis]
MALRTLAARMRTPAAAAALRLSPAPLVSPPAGTVRGYFTSYSFQGRPEEDVKRLYLKNLKMLNGMKDYERAMNKRIRTLTVRSNCLKWSFRLLFPIPLAATVLKVSHDNGFI